ncbi:hypothetical protein VIBNISOn1_450029 [Vibrio nigripulchritudo SOn1]|uniref:Uncharacterized protein n=1 Tax=Vibrio nigripulchritudo SOn1 TaxID=1238450 RepID=A0AAV2VTU7_9VIBR|nr:hypothetical protein VIBNISOn1_450029 [Vibrio nigripulchritudo SOn1]
MDGVDSSGNVLTVAFNASIAQLVAFFLKEKALITNAKNTKTKTKAKVTYVITYPEVNWLATVN